MHYVCSCWENTCTTRLKIDSPHARAILYWEYLLGNVAPIHSCRSPLVLFGRTQPPKQRLSSCASCKVSLCLTPCLQCIACTLSFLSSVFDWGFWRSVLVEIQHIVQCLIELWVIIFFWPNLKIFLKREYAANIKKVPPCCICWCKKVWQLTITKMKSWDHFYQPNYPPKPGKLTSESAFSAIAAYKTGIFSLGPQWNILKMQWNYPYIYEKW